MGAGSQNSSYSTLHSKLVEAGIIRLADPNATFSENYAFSSPSAAAAVMLGRSANGRTEWVFEGSIKSYGDWDVEQLALVPQ
ncbi:MAG: DUF4357 domain-containing protein [Rhodoferax sp.]|nr:DUF4357 domain-containing protein [Pseudorhodobacter sp.]